MSLRHKLAFIALFYVIEGFPMGVYRGLWPIFLRRHDVSLTEIGWLSALAFAWSAKVLWSPLVDRWGERRQWIAACMAVMAATLALLAGVDPRIAGAALWLLFAAYCLASATQDVAIDAYSIGLAERGEEGPFNSTKAIGYRVGMLLASSGLLLLPERIGWHGTFLVGAGLSALLALSVFTAPAVPVPPESRRETVAPLRRWLAQDGAPAVLGFVLLYRIGDMAMGPMVETFWVDRGLSDADIAGVPRAGGIAMYVLGAVVGGAVVHRTGIGRALWLLGAFALASNLGYAAAAHFPESGRAGIYAASLFESLCGGLASAAFLSFLMRICEKEHAAVQYALLTAIYAVAGSLLAAQSGWLAERLGYAAFFALTSLLALPAFALLPRAQRWSERRPVDV